jgi:hypothetical protein
MLFVLNLKRDREREERERERERAKEGEKWSEVCLIFKNIGDL